MFYIIDKYQDFVWGIFYGGRGNATDTVFASKIHPVKQILVPYYYNILLLFLVNYYAYNNNVIFTQEL